uniref:Uncharacterized protein n=1 Tax=Anopheles quadriannulatus TaxID=34691 RepID=A0A182XNQ9_ANOQN
MDRNMVRQGGMSMSPGVMRRPGGMGGRDMHPQNHAPSYQPQQNLVSATAGAMLNNGGSSNGPPPPSSVAPPSAMHPVMHPMQQNQQQQQQQHSQQVHQQQQQPQQPPQQTAQIQHSQHDELIRYINEAWNSITTDKSQKAPVFYKSGTEPRLSGFTPFDLERWWGQRMVHHINIGSHGHQ